MYSYIKGEYIENGSNFIIIENNGIGYKIFMSLTSIYKIGNVGDNIKVYTYYYVSEDNICLYGFASKEEFAMFELLISVSGVGPKSAIGMLSKIEPCDFAIAVINEDLKQITSLPGIGNKTAQRLVLELKDKIKKENSLIDKEEVKKVVKEDNLNEDAIQALQILGYIRKDIEKVLKNIDIENLKTEEIIKIALKYLS